MKKLIKYMSALTPVLIAALLQSACKKDGGYHDATGTNSKFAGNTYEYLKSKPGVYDSLLAVIN
ncbi:MAG TPA: ATP/GTP-binding protein, partial [Mucilaginibacter sp.]